MKRDGRIIALVAVVAAAGSLWADVTVNRRVTSRGIRGMGASEAVETRVIQGHRSREEAKKKFTGKVLKTLTRDQDRVTLTKLDEELIQILDVPRKAYSEMTFAQMRERREKAMADHQAASAKTKEEPAKPPTHRISKASFQVKPSTEEKAINGFACRKYLMEMLLEIEDLETHEKSEMRMTNTLWTTPQTAELKKSLDEEHTFAQLYLKKLGLENLPKDAAQMGTAMAASLSGAGEKDLAEALGRVAEETKKIQGYPVVTQVEWFVAGPPASAEKPGAAEPASDDDSIDAAHGVGGALGSFAGNWAKKKASHKMQQKTQSNAGEPAFSVTSEVQSVSVAPVSDGLFAVPAGFKKREL